MNTEKTEQELENSVFQTASIAQKHNCNLVRLDYQQEAGLMSSLPLAKNLIEIERVLTTSSTAIFIPFTTQELFQSGAGSLYYGVNAVSSNLIMTDWERGMRQAPEYVFNLFKEKVERDFNLEKKPSVRAALLMSKEEMEKQVFYNMILFNRLNRKVV